ncbi:MAG: ThuA domain-containing protein, partial [Bacteroidota bacterium]
MRRYTFTALFALVFLMAACTGAKQSSTNEADWVTLYDGSGTEGWVQAGPGEFIQEADGSLLGTGGMGMLYYAQQSFRDFILELDWKAVHDSANSGIFVRFPEQSDDPWYAVNNGYEIQIANTGGNPMQTTGAIYTFSPASHIPTKPAGQWNTYQIKVTGQRYEIFLNGEKVNDFFGDRGREGYIGIQNHDSDSKVWYRNIRVQPLMLEDPPETLGEHFAVTDERDPIKVLTFTTTHGFRHGGAIEALKESLPEIAQHTEFTFDITEDVSLLNAENLANYDLLFFANTTMRLKGEQRVDAGGGDAMGNFANYQIEMNTPQGAMGMVVALSGSADDLSGTIKADGAPQAAPLTDVVLDGNNLSFNFDSGQYGVLGVTASLAGDAFDGALAIGGMSIPMQGEKMAVPNDTVLQGERTWDVELETPQGAMAATVLLNGLEGSITFDGAPAAATLDEISYTGDQVNFSFDSGEYGVLPVTATLDGETFDGTLSVSGFNVPLTGTLTSGDPVMLSGGSGDGEPEEPEMEEVIYVTEAQQEAIMDFMREGKGFVGTHSATDTFHDWDDYRAMVGGGLFTSHPWTKSVRINVEEPGNPAMTHLGESFHIVDEIYVLDQNPRWNSRVLASLDVEDAGLQGSTAGSEERGDYPISWIRNHNGGRVFYTKLGHFDHNWRNPAFLQHLLQGMRMAAGRIDADFSGRRVKDTIADNVWPDDLAVDDKGNVWIAELTGALYRYDAETEESVKIGEIPTTDPVNIEHGLFGVEVDPDFYNGEPWVYLYYAEQETFINTLSRMRYENGQLDMDSEEILLRVPTEPQCCHQAGDIEWGPDKTLYLSTGDTGMSETRPDWEVSDEKLDAFFEEHGLDEDDYQWSRLVDSERTAQNLADLRGKIVRINRDGSIPKDNPFFGQAGARWEVYAYGLRNPYRFKLDPQTGYLFIGVVGPDEDVTYDEYNISREGGENFGWPRDNGTLVYNEWDPADIEDYEPPFWEYDYADGGRSASGGPVYRHEGPGAFPDVFQGTVFTYDWSRTWIKWGEIEERPVTLTKTNGETYTMNTLRLVNIKTFDETLMQGTRPISMELGPDGALYVAEFTGFWGPAPGSKVTRYRWVAGNEAPVSMGSVLGPAEGDPLTIRFSSKGSYDPNADTVIFAWAFGDGGTSSERHPTHTYAEAGTYTATLTLTDPDGLSHTHTFEVEVAEA